MKNTTDKSEIHLSMCKELNDLYIKKNADYSDSFAKLRNKFGNVAIILRLYDKLMRAEQLMLSEDEQMVKDESIDDTLRDLANYCLLELTERQYEHNRQSEGATLNDLKPELSQNFKTEIISAEAHNPEFKTELKSHGNWVDECTDTRGLE